MTAAQRQKRRYQRLRKAGLHPIRVWVRKERIELVRQFDEKATVEAENDESR